MTVTSKSLAAPRASHLTEPTLGVRCDADGEVVQETFGTVHEHDPGGRVRKGYLGRELHPDRPAADYHDRSSVCSNGASFRQRQAWLVPVSYTHLTLPTKRIV